MFKLLALSISVSLIPVTQKIVSVQNPAPVYAFNFAAAPSPFQQKKEGQPTTVDALKKGSWYGDALQNIAQSEYQFVWEEKLQAYCTPNRQNNLRFYYTEKGFSVEPRVTKIPLENYGPAVMEEEKKYQYIPHWQLHFALDKKQIGKGYWQVGQNKAEYITDNITVQYTNSKEGMRQNFIVQEPLSNDGALHINFHIQTQLKAYLHGNQLQFFHGNTHVLNYHDLQVWDANNKPLPASIQKNRKGGYAIQVDTKNAAYPITIDPISNTPNSTLDDANQAGANFGTAVASAGDVNGDGYSDVIIGASLYDDGANSNEGRAFVYHGSATGLSASPNSILDDANQSGAAFGTSVATAGDVNGDGYSDVIIGANLYDDGANTDEGLAFVYHGSATGLSASPSNLPNDANQANAYFGISVACAGDVNGDGYSDVIIGANRYDDGANANEGRAFIYHGSASGLSATPNATPDDVNQADARFGVAVASAGDVNGDGYSDVIIGANGYDDGAVASVGLSLVYHGSATGIAASPNTTLNVANQLLAQFGSSVACAGDVNGDGYSDVIIGAALYDDGSNGDEGRAYIHHGSATGLSTTPNSILDDANQAGAQFGISVACAGDVNGDGYSDVIIGASMYDENLSPDEGRVFLYHGSATGVAASPNATPHDASQSAAQFGVSVASAGDVNGDGYSDIIIGAHLYDDQSLNDEGRAYVYHGSASGIYNSPNGTIDDANQADAALGISVSLAGDVNGDGYSDAVIGAQRYNDGANANEGRAFVYHGSATGFSATHNTTLDNGNQANSQFGNSVAGAGDINADGYSDVIVGCYLYDDGTNTDEGRAFVYLGSAAGLSATPSSTPDDANQAGVQFGISVAGAGDVNGDGYSDVIVGAYFYDGNYANEGGAFVYYGSPTGLSATPNSTPDDADQINAQFGRSVASAGDVNGDGYGDVIVGAYGYDDGANSGEGRAFVYHGSAAGLSATPNSTPDDADQASALFGCAVACAGDVNGDGYSDVIIGAMYYDDGVYVNSGQAYIYHGSATGVVASPNCILGDADQDEARFGTSVANAGDLNGDGYSDVIIGASRYAEGVNLYEGLAFVYHGSRLGITASSLNSVANDADQSYAYFGESVSSAGDVDGDGYSDLIIGCHGYFDGPNNDEGRVFLYNGNGATNCLRNNLRLYNTNLTTPINNSVFLSSNFGAGLYAKSFLGRGKGKMVWETRLNYNAFSGTTITNSTAFTAQQAAYTDLGLAGTELKNLIAKISGGPYIKLRARVKYNPVTAITGQVYGPWRYVSSIIDGHNLGVIPVDLIAFKAAWLQKGKTATIEFMTENENNTCCYDIEKSTDGFHFSTIGTLSANNTPGRQSYSFIDNSATDKKQYYRLQIKDANGQVRYSPIQQLQHDKGATVLVFPNPATDVLLLQLNAVYDKMEVQILNSNGQLVKRLRMAATNQTIAIPVQQLAAGNYWLHLQAGDQKQVVQFVKR